MSLLRLDSEDVIVAVATAAGPSPRGIVRLSGRDCFAVAARVFSAVHPLQGPGFRTVNGRCDFGGGLSLPAVAWLFRSPASYTGQDMIELMLPGNPPLLEQAAEVLISAGARMAEPGEFTLRAVLAGKLDLTGAEAVAERIAARSDGQLRAANQLAAGALARAADEQADRLADLLAEVEAALDFADEPIVFISPGKLAEGLAAVRSALTDLAERASSFELLEHRPTVALVGLPNAGKSTLLNRLTGLERSLCSPLAGTTRDVLAAPLALDDGDVLLLDAAGLDECGSWIADCKMTGGPRLVEQAAQESARRAMAVADVLLIVLDATRSMDDQWNALSRQIDPSRQQVVVANKSDVDNGCDSPGGADGLPARAVRARVASGSSRIRCDTDDLPASTAGSCEQAPAAPPVLNISALTGHGLDELRAALNAAFADRAGRAAEGMMLNARHRSAVASAVAAIGRALDLFVGQGQLDAAGDLVAGEMREAVEQLGSITGRSLADDVLDRIFSRFCLGK